jgi:hypothetical protein
MKLSKLSPVSREGVWIVLDRDKSSRNVITMTMSLLKSGDHLVYLCEENYLLAKMTLKIMSE